MSYYFVLCLSTQTWNQKLFILYNTVFFYNLYFIFANNVKMSRFIEVQLMDIYSIRHPRFYAIYFIWNHIFKKYYCEVISKRILIIFAPEEAEIFKDYFLILAWFSVRLPLFSFDLKTIFAFWRQICYIF